MARTRLVQRQHFEWLSSTISPVPGVIPLGFFPESEADWQAVITLGSAHLVLPILYKSLCSKKLWDKVPEEVAAALEGFFELNQLHNERLRQQVIEVTRTLNSRNITPVWLKGATELLAEDWQQSPRMMLDLDFWLPDPIVHAPALAALEADGYFIPPYYAGCSDTSGHHFLRRMKDNMPAGIEIHRNIVGAPGDSLLTNADALSQIHCQEWEGTQIGVLSQSDQCMQSYIQCTEMNKSGLMLGQLKLMKAHDFLIRFQQLHVNEQRNFLNRLYKAPWLAHAEAFFSYLHAFFRLPAHSAPSMQVLTNHPLVHRVRANYEPGFWINPTSMFIGYNVALIQERLRDRNLGSPSAWFNKALRLIRRVLAYHPEL